MSKNIGYRLVPMLACLLSFGCERVEPSTVHPVPKVAAFEEATLSSRGYTMTINGNYQLAQITTVENGQTPMPSDPMLVPGPTVPEIGMTGEIVNMEDGNGIMTPYEVIDLPEDGRNYWIVPFRRGLFVVNIDPNHIDVLMGPCGCWPGNGSCTTIKTFCLPGTCLSCSRGFAFLLSGQPIRPEIGDPFALVAAAAIEYNGVLYQ